MGQRAQPYSVGMQQQPPLTSREACERLSVSEDTLRRYLNRGAVRGFRLPSGVWRIPLSEILRIIGAEDSDECRA